MSCQLKELAKRLRMARRSIDLGTFKLPGGKTPRVEMVRHQTGRDAVLIELDFKLHLVGRNRFPTDGASPSAPGAAEQEILSACGQFPIQDCLLSHLSEQRFVRHSGASMRHGSSQDIEIAIYFRKDAVWQPI